MTPRGSRSAACLLLAALLSADAATGQQADLTRELDGAKALYQAGRFGQAIAKLQTVIGRLEQLRDMQVAKGRMADAHLYLALSHIGLNDPAAARESLTALARLDPRRSLDPNVYAPKVIELFEQAKAEVATEPALTGETAGPTGAAPSSAAPPGKQRRSKTLPILLGAAAVAGAGVAVAAGAGGGGNAKPGPPAATTTTPSPAPTLPNDIVLLAASPPSGSTISLSGAGTGPLFTLTVSVQNIQRTGDYALFGAAPTGNQAELICASGNAQSVHLVAGDPPRTFSVPLSDRSRCAIPYTLPRVEVILCPMPFPPCQASGPTSQKFLSLTYTIVP